jgi:hypothetical protein
MTLTRTQRSNLRKLADYLETLPRRYRHFDMTYYAEHRGECELEVGSMPATAPDRFLSNCGAVACAVGHGPAAGVRMRKSEYENAIKYQDDIDWNGYSERAFGADPNERMYGGLWHFLFGPQWRSADNTPWGAAARIRYILKHREPPPGWNYKPPTVKLYDEYRVDRREAAHV